MAGLILKFKQLYAWESRYFFLSISSVLKDGSVKLARKPEFREKMLAFKASSLRQIWFWQSASTIDVYCYFKARVSSNCTLESNLSFWISVYKLRIYFENACSNVNSFLANCYWGSNSLEDDLFTPLLLLFKETFSDSIDSLDWLFFIYGCVYLPISWIFSWGT